MDALRREPGFLCELPEDEERACARERPALRIQEQLWAVPLVEIRPAAGEVAVQRVDGRPADRDDPLLRALAERADEALLRVDARPVEADRLADAETGAVQELDECGVAQVPRRHAVRGLDQPLDLAG